MRRHHIASHTAEEMRRLSNLGHLLEGLVLATVGILAILGSLGMVAWAPTAWPLVILLAGVLLLALIYPLHPLSDWPAIWRDPQQRQHTIIAAALMVAGTSELLQSSSARSWGYVWPVVLIVIGVLFLTHAQHGRGRAVARAVLLHRILGITLIGAGLLRAIEGGTEASIFAFLWPLALLIAAAQLIVYREPEGAFEEESHAGHGWGKRS
jgi:hypothetical protein